MSFVAFATWLGATGLTTSLLETIRVLKTAVQMAKLAREEELGALKRLDEQARTLEWFATGPSVPDLIAQERERSHLYGGRSVFGWEQPPDAN